MEFTKCCICGSVEPVPDEMLEAVKRGEPVVCDRPECETKAREWAWSQLLSQYIEAKRLPNGEMAFRMKVDA